MYWPFMLVMTHLRSNGRAAIDKVQGLCIDEAISRMILEIMRSLPEAMSDDD